MENTGNNSENGFKNTKFDWHDMVAILFALCFFIVIIGIIGLIAWGLLIFIIWTGDDIRYDVFSSVLRPVALLFPSLLEDVEHVFKVIVPVGIMAICAVACINYVIMSDNEIIKSTKKSLFLIIDIAASVISTGIVIAFFYFIYGVPEGTAAYTCFGATFLLILCTCKCMALSKITVLCAPIGIIMQMACACFIGTITYILYDTILIYVVVIGIVLIGYALLSGDDTGGRNNDQNNDLIDGFILGMLYRG